MIEVREVREVLRGWLAGGGLWKLAEQADGQPGQECQVDFGKMGLIYDPASGRRRVTHALIFTAVYYPSSSRQ